MRSLKVFEEHLSHGRYDEAVALANGEGGCDPAIIRRIVEEYRQTDIWRAGYIASLFPEGLEDLIDEIQEVVETGSTIGLFD